MKYFIYGFVAGIFYLSGLIFMFFANLDYQKAGGGFALIAGVITMFVICFYDYNN